jgi:hypothetical protein
MMTLIESYLDQLQTEKLDVNQLINKANKTFQSVYKSEVENCFAKQEREQYSNPYADLSCEKKAQLSAYKKVLKRLNNWIKHCKDQKCVNQVKLQQNKIQSKINYLQNQIE